MMDWTAGFEALTVTLSLCQVWLFPAAASEQFWSLAVMSSTVHGSGCYPLYKLTFWVLVSISLVAVTFGFFSGYCPPSASLFSPLSSFCLTLGVISVVSLCLAVTYFCAFVFLCAMAHRKRLRCGFSWCCSSHARAAGWLSFLCWRKHQAEKGQPDVSYIAWKLLDGVFPFLTWEGKPWRKMATS